MYNHGNMFDFAHGPVAASDAALRRSFNSLPVPIPSAEFDAQVLERLAQTVSWWRRLGSLARTLKPALTAAAATIPVALLAIAMLGRTADTISALPAAPPGQTASMLPVDQALDSPNLSPATLRRLSREESATRGRSGRNAAMGRTA